MDLRISLRSSEDDKNKKNARPKMTKTKSVCLEVMETIKSCLFRAGGGKNIKILEIFYYFWYLVIVYC